jgi:hypothetical protein
MAAINITGIFAKMMAQDAWGKRTHPQLAVGKVAHGLMVKPLGQLEAFEFQGKAQWSKLYEPRQMTELDERRYKKLKTKMRALARQIAKLEKGAFDRGYPISISSVVRITNEREKIG